MLFRAKIKLIHIHSNELVSGKLEVSMKLIHVHAVEQASGEFEVLAVIRSDVQVCQQYPPSYTRLSYIGHT